MWFYFKYFIIYPIFARIFVLILGVLCLPLINSIYLFANNKDDISNIFSFMFTSFTLLLYFIIYRISGEEIKKL
jgi:hypothetical protein